MAANNIKSGGTATFIVKVGGTAVPDALNILSVQLEKKVNRIATARIVVLNGEPTGTFAASSSATFVPGGVVTIEGGYSSQNQLLFKGIITGQTINMDDSAGSTLQVECWDAAIKMTVGRKSMTFSKQKDSDIISSLIGSYSGLTAAVTDTLTTMPEQVQYYVSDWDFILALAEANGLIVTTINGTVSVSKPDANTTPVLSVAYGDGLLAFNADMNAINQLSLVTASSWDYRTQAVLFGDASNNVPGPGNISSNTLSQVIGPSDYQLQTSGALESADLATWSKAQLIKSEYSKILGTAKFQGTSIAELAKYITFNGLGDRFNGDYFISGVVHDFSEGNWLTQTNLGLSPGWVTEKPDVMAPPASGLLPGARGLFNGTVKQLSNDPDGQYRILVNVPLFDANGAGIWARLANFYATSGAGAFFLPEVGDEVVLGFLNEDPRYPIILGSLYSSLNAPSSGLNPNEKNSLKAIVSKSGISLQFDDENKILTIVTPSENTVVLDDNTKQITIQDQNSNRIVMSADGISMKSSKNISIEAGQMLTLKGDLGISVQSSEGDTNISGINVSAKAQIQASIEGSASAKLIASGEVTVKGAMVMIN